MSATARTEGMAEIAAGWRSAWQLLIGVGALLAVLGLVAIIYPAAATATINIMAGIFLIIAGVLLFGFAFAAREAGDVIIWIAIGVLAIIVGIVFLSAPDIGTVTLTVLLAVWFILSGLAKLAAAYEQRGRIQLYMNHELEGTPSDARVSHLTLNGDRQVVAAEYVLDGSEGFTTFCSSSLSIISGVPTYLTGEEALPGRSIALDATTGEYRKTNQFGYFEHENVIALEGLPFGLFVSTEDGPPDHSQLYAYGAESLGDEAQPTGD